MIKHSANKMIHNIVYRSYDAALVTLKEHEQLNPEAIASFLAIFNKLLNNKVQNAFSGRFPLVVLEGLDGCGKSSVGYRLAKEINGWRWTTPPKSVKHLREQFDNCPLIRTPFYTLSNYIAAMEIETMLLKRPIVLDRFWHSTSAFAMAQAVADKPDLFKLPEPNDLMYKWPEDLLKPNIVFFLDVTEDVRQKRHAERSMGTTKQEQLLTKSDDFRNNVVKAFRRMYEPNVTIVDGNLDFEELIPELVSQLQPYLSLSVPK